LAITLEGVTATLLPTPANADVDIAVLRTRAGMLARLAILLICASQLVLSYLTVVLWQQVDPVQNPVSDYVFHGPGGPLFVVAILLVLLGGLALVAGMHSVGMPRARAAHVLFGLWGGGLLLVAGFHGNRSATDPTLPGEIHRIGGAVFLTCLPLACWTLARRLAADPRWAAKTARIRGLTMAGFATAVAFGLAQVVPSLPEGLLERLALGAELLLLLSLAFEVRRAAQ
jgi:hypothetical protein